MTTKTILITGGTSGIGREAALLLSKQGHRVYAASRRPPIEPMLGVRYVPLDVRSSESIRDCVQSVLAHAGQIDVLVNNAGYVGPAGASEEVSLEDVRSLFETNFFGVVQIVNAVLPAMRQRRSGLILNVSSAAGRMATPPFFGFYAASKHALEGYSEALSSELRPLGVRVAVIEPGYFVTNIHTTFNPPANPLGDFTPEREHAIAMDRFSIRHGRDPRKVAQLISRLVNGTPFRLRYPIGLDARYMLTLHALLPEKVFEGYLRWFLIGGQPVKTSDDDNTLRRKIGFRRYLLESPLADRLMTGTWVTAVLLGMAGLVSLLKQKRLHDRD
jgi:NAD(P)-dependent dehydrogenase (short-subunit alcohol dehydrogenase family)